MKNSILIAVIGLFSTTAFAQVNYIEPNGARTFDKCGFNSPSGQVCKTETEFGQTLGYQPIKASVTTSFIFNQEPRSADADLVAHVTITKLEDPTDFYHSYGNMAISATAKICNYHRTCYWEDQTNSFTMNRTYGTRVFENGPSFDVHVKGNSGGEEEGVLTEIDFYLPQQTYPIVVRF